MTAPTFVGVKEVPTDGASAANAGPTVTIDKDAGALSSAQTGDLIVVVAQYRGLANSSTLGQILPNEYGGQNWNIERGATGNNHHCRMFWCRFNGTWTADPTFSRFVSGAVSGTLALTAVAMVFRPDSSSKHWVVCNGVISGSFTAGSSPFTKTITGLTPRKDDTVTIAVWSTADDNTWGSLSGTNWTQSGLSAQYRNTTGSDQSLAIAYQLQGTAAATNNVSLNQATLGGDAGRTQIVSFAAITMPEGATAGTQSLVQSDRTADASSGSTSVATLSAVTSGNGVVIDWNFETTGGAEIVSIDDDQGNEYVQIGRWSDMCFEQMKVSAFCPNITNGPTTFTGTLSAGEIFRHIYAREVAYLGKLNVAVGYVSLNPDTFSTWNPATPSRTPSVDDCILLGHAFTPGGANIESAADDADGWTLDFGGINGSPDEPNSAHHQVQGSAAAEDYDIDMPANQGVTGIVMGWAAFEPILSGGATTRGMPFGNEGNAFSGGRVFFGPMR